MKRYRNTMRAEIERKQTMFANIKRSGMGKSNGSTIAFLDKIRAEIETLRKELNQEPGKTFDAIEEL